ncbi:hypothetical protein LC082_08370 [Microbacterium esteraromaticum]|uniref:hypothetical protein n=1 Tax=Microbacterium esteraromaticum TaxID=57043 RepID=UPI001CD2AD6A|nr:hypothetical protein [Microbacterium esteraromaticum]MCA1306911.1 hypothetical protein [Microbacterium esteraromaticum]
MTAQRSATGSVAPNTVEPSGRLALWGAVAAFVLIAAAIAVPAVTGWNVHVRWFPPLHAEWAPRVGPGLPVAIAVGVLVIAYGDRVARTLRWGGLLPVVFAAALAWLLSLALIDGLDGIGTILDHRYEYLGTAREVTDFTATLREYVSRIPFAHPDNWPVHIAGHPPGALLFFYLLVQLGLGSALAAGFVVTVIGATIPIAVLDTMRTLGAETHARRAAPLLAIGPAAIWIAVSGDGMFAAVAAWGIWALARATRAGRHRRVGKTMLWAVLAGLLLGYCVMLSYGLPLLGVLAVAVLIAGRSWWPLPVAAATALAVVLAFAVAGFAWWEAFPVLHQRYWDGVASNRPAAYWLWGNLAAFAISAGPMVGASLAGAVGTAARGFRTPRDEHPSGIRIVLLLTLAGWLMVALADVSGMSRAEVERIWLPFVPWALLGLSLFSPQVRRVALAVQVVFAIVVQSLLQTGW